MRLPWLAVGSAALACALLAPAASAAALDLTIGPGKFDEYCVKLAAGAELKYRFKAGAAVDFNIHHHRDQEVFYPVKRDAVLRLVGRFRAPSADDYCLMWENKGTKAVTMRGRVDP